MSSRFRRPSYKSGQNHRRGYDVEAATPRVERPRRRQRLSAFWLAPFIAAVLGIYLTLSYYNEKGPLITCLLYTSPSPRDRG